MCWYEIHFGHPKIFSFFLFLSEVGCYRKFTGISWNFNIKFIGNNIIPIVLKGFGEKSREFWQRLLDDNLKLTPASTCPAWHATATFFKRAAPQPRGNALGKRPAQKWRALRTVPPQTLGGSLSAVSKPNFARKYALESSWRDLHNALLCTPLQSRIFRRFQD